MSKRIGAEVQMTENALENYGEQYRGKTFKVTHIARNRGEHPGYDEGAGGALYDLSLDGKNFPNSLYDWELA